MFCVYMCVCWGRGSVDSSPVKLHSGSLLENVSVFVVVVVIFLFFSLVVVVLMICLWKLLCLE